MRKDLIGEIQGKEGEQMSRFLLAAFLLVIVALCMLLVSKESDPVEMAAWFIIGLGLIAFLAWFVLNGPTPSYLPPYGSGTQPMEMRD